MEIRGADGHGADLASSKTMGLGCWGQEPQHAAFVLMLPQTPLPWVFVGLCCHQKSKENSVPVASEKGSFMKRFELSFFRGVSWLHAYLATDLRLVFKCIT